MSNPASPFADSSLSNIGMLRRLSLVAKYIVIKHEGLITISGLVDSPPSINISPILRVSDRATVTHESRREFRVAHVDQ